MSLQPKFESLSEETGLDIIDPVETRHFSLLTNESVRPTPTDPEEFTFPVDTACRISTDEFRLPYMIPVDVRTPDGDHLASIDTSTTHELSAGTYLLELHSPIKIYVRVSASGRIEATTEGVTFEFDGRVDVEVGARSYHSEPAATITVPDDPEAMMEAISAFPSALKTTSPERAWPTLRGHPPRIERGDELAIPDDLETPDTGIEITIPPEYWAVYTVAPLAYYLGATVVPGDRMRVTARSGIVHHLGTDPEELADATTALLKRVFFLDCVTRTEGLYPDDLHERELLESHVNLDLAGLYEIAPGERLSAYLSVPDDAIEAIASSWHRVTHVQPDAETVELLPYVVNDLSLVRPKVDDSESEALTVSETELNDGIDAFLRQPSEDNDSATCGVPELDEYVSLPETDALEQAWVGDGTPLHGAKLIREAFTHDTPEPSDGTIEITVVCNDPEMHEELAAVGEIYGSRDDVRADVTSEFGVRTTRLRELLAEDTDLFHFIGHIDGHGFQCPDGVLDAATIDETNATTALLNGCRSHDQGVELVKAGASAAVVSLDDLFNSGAVEVGETLAQLLHHGFSVGSSMEIIREYTSIGDRYAVVGDPGVVIVQYERLVPTLYHIRAQNDDRLTIEPHSYSVRGYEVGTTFKPLGFKSENYQIMGGFHKRVTISESDFREAILDTGDPVITNGQLIWSDVWFDQS